MNITLTSCLQCGVLAISNPRPECSAPEGHQWAGLGGVPDVPATERVFTTPPWATAQPPVLAPNGEPPSPPVVEEPVEGVSPVVAKPRSVIQIRSSSKGPRIRVPGQPVTRGECLPGGPNEARPCPYDACRYHLDENPKGASCALDVADDGPHSLEEVGEIIGVTRERTRQIEAKALFKLNRRDKREGLCNGTTLRDFID